jgi:hypothetical protein
VGCRCKQAKRAEQVAFGTCDVCRLVRKDDTPKLVRYCAVCKTWLCERCSRDWPARARAALLKRVEEVRHALAE